MTVKSVAKNLVEKDFYRAQSEFVANLIRFVDKTNSHVFLVAHPKKTDRDIEGDDVSGSGDIINLCHNMISIKRVFNNPNVDSSLTIRKNRFYGDVASDLGLIFDSASKRFAHWEHPEDLDKRYGWQDFIQIAK